MPIDLGDMYDNSTIRWRSTTSMAIRRIVGYLSKRLDLGDLYDQ